MDASYFRYWGKARKDQDQQGDDYHLLPYHSLDVAAVAARWWDHDHSANLRRGFLTDSVDEKRVRAWMLFFIALHDIGKFDVRFQCKSLDSWLALHPEDKGKALPSVAQCKGFDHGKAGLYWFGEDYRAGSPPSLDDWLFIDVQEPVHLFHAWYPWIESVTGHHGYVMHHEQLPDHQMPYEFRTLAQRDKQARMAWLATLETLFLVPEGLTLQAPPPQAASILAGFCSIADWLGSWLTNDTFCYKSEPAKDAAELQAYFDLRYAQDAAVVLQRSGLLSRSKQYEGIHCLLDRHYQPRQLQVLVDRFPVSSGLTLVEAPTGSGKTETALAYAWRLVAAGLADSIIFALPTQATANAMLQRLDKLADMMFDAPNMILAHGNSRFNESFSAIKQRGRNIQGTQEAWSQCCEWLSQSRKRVFLGQIGVCTVDQVLVSVLPVRHRFVRGFGVARSVLIVDEVHAYDSYMNGLLHEVLRQQSQSGACAILLSATLPEEQKHALLATYGSGGGEPVPVSYPQVLWRNAVQTESFHLDDQPDQLPAATKVQLEALYLPDLQPDNTLLERMVRAAEGGAQVCLICNLVDVAQRVFTQLSETAAVPVLLFHARFTLEDRKAKESRVLDCFGPNGDRATGRILIATQVVEQSLDLDFDWLITQLCPVDLLFQRLGRLHRHNRGQRPAGFEAPLATIILPAEADYGVHGKIYANSLVMWRTQQAIESLADKSLVFPAAYRQWIEPIYQPEPEGTEPQWVLDGLLLFEDDELRRRSNASQMLSWAGASPFSDDADKIRAVTRDGEMSLPVVPYIETAQGRRLLDGQVLEQLQEFDQQEALALNRVNVPCSWKRSFVQEMDEDGLIWLPGKSVEHGFRATGSNSIEFHYSQEQGLERTK